MHRKWVFFWLAVLFAQAGAASTEIAMTRCSKPAQWDNRDECDEEEPCEEPKPAPCPTPCNRKSAARIVEEEECLLRKNGMN